MNNTELIKLRLFNQQLTTHHHTSAKSLVSYMGAMQAQDFAMSKWAIGLRLKNSKENLIETAINKGEIIRTHVLRPTWHFVAPDDVYWMLQLSAPAIRIKMRTHEKQLGITDAVIKKASKIIEQELSKQSYNRDELTAILQKKKITVSEYRFAHYMMHAELNGIACSGAIINNKFTYDLFDKRIKTKTKFSKEEAIHALVTKYFQSHGPAKASDFMWWSGLTAKVANEAVSMLDNSFVKETFNKEVYWLKQSSKPAAAKQNMHLLPAYDEYIISYKDRTNILTPEAMKQSISANGIFWPVVLVNGKVFGKWSRKIIKNELQVEVQNFSPLSPPVKNKLKTQATAYAKYVNKKLLPLKFHND